MALLSALGAGGVASAQCAMCNTAAGAGSVGRGLSISVLFMLGILGAVVACFVVAVSRSSSRRDSTSDGNPPSS
ncbi:MAG TPA: hypothetical protein VFB95_08280 [Candidatus Cryosericum sp.]|nr:hypothetical protein [Candidatus Cryosericum sp.]